MAGICRRLALQYTLLHLVQPVPRQWRCAARAVPHGDDVLLIDEDPGCGVQGVITSDTAWLRADRRRPSDLPVFLVSSVMWPGEGDDCIALADSCAVVLIRAGVAGLIVDAASARFAVAPDWARYLAIRRMRAELDDIDHAALSFRTFTNSSHRMMN